MSYATLADARAEGITTDQASDVRLQALLDAASERIDALTGWWFEPREKSFDLDGQENETLPLPAPIITLTSVTLDGALLNLTTDVIVKGRVTDLRADVQYPRLLRKQAAAWELPGSAERPRWSYGVNNVSVVGVFGYTKSDGTTPPAEIREVCLRLALRNLALLTDAAGQAERERGRVFRESTDGHSYELGSTLPGAVGAWRSGGTTGDPNIDVILAGYRRPTKSALAGVPRPTARPSRGWP
jgi:hypothetical protein